MLRPYKVAVIGCGVISGVYLKNLCNFFHITDVVGCSDIIAAKSQARAEEFGIRQMTNEQIFADPEIAIVVNLTYPTAHYDVTRAALLAGKHVYTEKMLAVTLQEGEELYALARDKGLWLAAAPDTFLGGGLQTARFAIDSGMIGQPVTVTGFCQRSYRLNRPDAEIRMVHKAGGGIPFDMGGYYLHAFVSLFGPVAKATGFADIRERDRAFINPHSPLYGQPWREECINTFSAALLFASGVMGSLVITSESADSALQYIQVVGTEGALRIHDPNDFMGEVAVKRPADSQFMPLPCTHPFAQGNMRGLGVADLAYAIKNGRAPRAEAGIGLHAFEVVHRVWESAGTGVTYDIAHLVARPAPLPPSGHMGQTAECVLDT